MKNYQNPFGFNPNMSNQQGLGYGPGLGAGFGPEGMPMGMNIPQMGYPGAGFPQEVQGSYPSPTHQHMMNDDCGCGSGPAEGEAMMPAAFNPYGPGMAPNMMMPHGPHGPGCTCGQQQGPMGGPGMMGGFDPQGSSVGPMSGFGPQGPGVGPMSGFGPQGPGVGPMSGFGPQGPGMAPGEMGGFGPGGPGNPGMMSPQGPGMAPNLMMPHGPHGPGCTCGQQQGPMGGPGMMGGFGR
ncbi:hypothetical protein [Ferdinandcohnia sp. SAFN-114]|uniref:hypothetical protein n=1 Tax=Ferdinandcohnia sp. SAFN-114 TaxID=3387275 RepID=UPI003F80C853